MYQAILFDFDGVLVDSFIYHAEAWQSVFAASGGTLEPETVYLNEGQPVKIIAYKLAEAAGVSLSDEALAELIAAKNAYFQQHNRATFLPGVLDFLQQVRAQNLRTGLVTGTLLKNLEIIVGREHLNAFDVVITDGDTKRGKPHPDPYLLAAEKLGVPPSACLVIENAPMGIRAAKAAGMTCIALMTSLSREHLQGADDIFLDYAELLDNFPRILSSRPAV